MADNYLLTQQLRDERKKQLQDNQRQLGSYEQQLKEDNQRRHHTRDLMLQLQEQQAQSEVWQQLSSVIGSADGKVFRNAAQQMTLDVLLFYTNAHLKDLAKRYLSVLAVLIIRALTRHYLTKQPPSEAFD